MNLKEGKKKSVGGSGKEEREGRSDVIIVPAECVETRELTDLLPQRSQG